MRKATPKVRLYLARQALERYYREDEAIVIRAEFYDDNWQLTNRPEVECQITPKEGGASTRYEFQPSSASNYFLLSQR